jgi:hypothetical protein
VAAGKRVLVVIVNPELTVMLNPRVIVCAGLPESVTFTVNEEVPTAVGVPLIVPFESRVSPEGKAPVSVHL